MIYIDRSRVEIPTTLSGRTSMGKTETKEVIAFYALSTNQGESFEGYVAYNEEDVKEHLNVLFDYKCAYCEMDYGGAPLDIEHYRPKGAIIELDPVTYKPYKKSKKVPALKPGYYWLAAHWENLLPSCIDCNRRRTHEYRKVGKEVTGKGNYFPLAIGSTRARKHTQHVALRNEQPLLLNPCNDDPSQHLHFDDEANVFGHTERGVATIKVLGLQRDPLVRKRHRVLVLLQNSIANIKEARAALKFDPDNEFAKKIISTELKTIKERYLVDSAPFLAMVGAAVKAELGI